MDQGDLGRRRTVANIDESATLMDKCIGPSKSTKQQQHGRLAAQRLSNRGTSSSIRRMLELGSSEYVHLIHIISIHEPLRLQAHILAPGA